jgi:hypothetical protein
MQETYYFLLLGDLVDVFVVRSGHQDRRGKCVRRLFRVNSRDRPLKLAPHGLFAAWQLETSQELPPSSLVILPRPSQESTDPTISLHLTSYLILQSHITVHPIHLILQGHLTSHLILSSTPLQKFRFVSPYFNARTTN